MLKTFTVEINSFIDGTPFITLPLAVQSCREVWFLRFRKFIPDCIFEDSEIRRIIGLSSDLYMSDYNFISSSLKLANYFVGFIDNQIKIQYGMVLSYYIWESLEDKVKGFIDYYDLDCDVEFEPYVAGVIFKSDNHKKIKFYGRHAIYVVDYLILMDRLLYEGEGYIIQGEGYSPFYRNITRKQYFYIAESEKTYDNFMRYISIFEERRDRNVFLNHPNLFLFSGCSGLYAYVRIHGKNKCSFGSWDLINRIIKVIN